MTLNLFTKTTVGVIAWRTKVYLPGETDPMKGEDVLQLGIGTAHAHLTKDDANKLADYLTEFAKSE